MACKTYDIFGVIFFSLFTIIFTTTVQAKELVVGFSYAKPPYVFAQTPMQTGEVRGIELDIMRAALAKKGHSFRPRYFSYNRLGDALKAGRVDVIATVRPELDGPFYSEEFVYFHNFAISRLGSSPVIADINSLSSRSIVAWQGATKDLGVDYEKAVQHSSLYKEIGDQQQQVVLFLLNRVNTIVIDGAIFKYWASILGHDSKTFEFKSIFGGKTSFVAGFNDEQIRDDFNAALLEMKKDGSYQKVYDKYGTN